MRTTTYRPAAKPRDYRLAKPPRKPDLNGAQSAFLAGLLCLAFWGLIALYVF